MNDEAETDGDRDRAKARRIVSRIEERREVHRQMHWLPRVMVATVGFLVLLAGLAMLFLPGPAILVIPIGLAILSLEFVWAERLLEKALESGATFGGWLGRLVRHRNFLLVGAGLLAGGAVAGFLLLV
ncbi:MAG: PGPGW domain-containing protein [Solirubrobacterales bacterium]